MSRVSLCYRVLLQGSTAKILEQGINFLIKYNYELGAYRAITIVSNLSFYFCTSVLINSLL